MEEAFAAATGAVKAVFGFQGVGGEGIGVEAADFGIAAGDILEEVKPARKSDDVGDAGVELWASVGEVHAVGVNHRERVAAVGLGAIDGVGRVKVVMEHSGFVKPGGEDGEGAGERAVELSGVVQGTAYGLEVGGTGYEVAVSDESPALYLDESQGFGGVDAAGEQFKAVMVGTTGFGGPEKGVDEAFDALQAMKTLDYDFWSRRRVDCEAPDGVALFKYKCASGESVGQRFDEVA